jgi:hypothetical protein
MIRWAGHVACMGGKRYSYDILIIELEGGDHMEDLGIDGSIILKLLLKKEDGSV